MCHNSTNQTNSTNYYNNYNNTSLYLSIIIIVVIIFVISSCFICLLIRYQVSDYFYENILIYLPISFVTFASPQQTNPNIHTINVKEKIPPLKPPDGVLVINPSGEDYAFGANIHG
jgi:hypothetical protein